MSFSQDIKTEIASQKISQNIDLIKSEVLGYIFSCVNNIDDELNFINENKEVILRYIYFFKNILDFVVVEDANLQKKINKKAKKKIQYILNIVKIERYIENIQNLKNKINNINTQDEKYAFLKGAFLGSGYVVTPKGDYHLEIIVGTEKIAALVKKYLYDIDIQSNIVMRKNKYVVYIKDSDNIVDFLIGIGVNKGVLKFEETRIIKEVNNTVNRVINCETGNLVKLISAAKDQILDIEYLKKHHAFEKLTEKQQEIANIRLKNPEYSLVEIANEVGISKSGANNRFKQIHNIVSELKGKKYE
ncbi:MAG: DNA-binding protein WhiA [Clostridia bacterium]|nr:DNA-binding protein WhiA [Clostridia bacterium]